MNEGPISFIANLVSKAAWPAISIQWHTSLAFKALFNLHICMLISFLNIIIEYNILYKQINTSTLMYILQYINLILKNS